MGLTWHGSRWGSAPRRGWADGASGREGKAGCCVNLALLPAALERRIPPQKESTPTPRVTHLPAPLPRTHTALTLRGRRRAAGRQPRTGQGASPGPFPREESPSTGRTGTLCLEHPLPATGIAALTPARAPHAEASMGAGPPAAPRQGAGRWVLADGRGRPGQAGRAPALGGSGAATTALGLVRRAGACPASPGAAPRSCRCTSRSAPRAGPCSPMGDAVTVGRGGSGPA